MRNLRKYGKKPFRVAVVHGGPGAPGEMAPVARELSRSVGVLEPLQTKLSIEGQIKELHEVLKANDALPVILIGWSWGAWLGYIFSARYPLLVRKLVLVGSGPFEEKYVSKITKIRLGRLNEKEKLELQNLEELLSDSSIKNKNQLFSKFGELFNKTDSYNPLSLKSEVIKFQFDIYQSVWKEASMFRCNGELLKLGKEILCPVVAIHGDYDPHPFEGVKKPLSRVLKGFNSFY